MRSIIWSSGFRWARRLLIATCIVVLTACGDDDRRAAGHALPTPTATPIESLHHQFITDSQGRALILHGVNVSGSAKDDPLRLPWITRNDAERVARDWGFDAVRFLIFWDAVEPMPGQYDDAYLDRVAERIDWFANAGVFVVLDMHQDVYGKFDMQGRTLGFDGAPAWAARTDGLPHHLLDPWSLTYTQPGVRRAFDNFWDTAGPHHDVQERYAAMWAHVAARFRGQPWVLGYNLMNEPFAGNAAYGELAPGIALGDPALSMEFQHTKFRSFHERMIAAIRAVDPNGWIFYEPLTFPTANGGPSDLGVLQDSRGGENRLVYFPHLYPISPELAHHYDPTNAPEVDSWERERMHELEEQRGPLLIGEFGLPWDAGGDPLGYLERIMQMADRFTSGWELWSYDIGGWSPVGGNDLHENPNVNVLVRVYPQRIAGQPILYSYDPPARRFHLVWVDRAGVSGPTEIYIPARRFYPEGWQLEVSDPAGTWSSAWDAAREVVSVSTTPTGGTHELRVEPSAQAQ